jgi:hypothetical protein
VHVSTSVLLWIFVLRLYLSTRERLLLPVEPADATAAAPASAPAT